MAATATSLRPRCLAISSKVRFFSVLAAKSCCMLSADCFFLYFAVFLCSPPHLEQHHARPLLSTGLDWTGRTVCECTGSRSTMELCCTTVSGGVGSGPGVWPNTQEIK